MKTYLEGVSRVSPTKKLLDAARESSPMVFKDLHRKEEYAAGCQAGGFSYACKVCSLHCNKIFVTKENTIKRRTLMKKRSIIVKKVTCFALAGIICAQMFPAKVFANGIANWNLYSNPTRPPAESKLSWSSSLTSTQSTAKCQIRGGISGTVVTFANDTGSIKVPTEGDSLSTTRGHVYVFTVKYYDPTKYVNNTRGTITY